MELTIAAMTAEIRENNIAKGWRNPAGGPGQNTLGDYIALLNSEVGEVTDGYRRWKLADATSSHERVDLDGNVTGPAKPEGVGSEFADVLIRLLDTGDVFGFPVADQYQTLDDVPGLSRSELDAHLPMFVTFGDHMSWVSHRILCIWPDPRTATDALRALVTVARTYGIDLEFEYRRKSAYNRTRAFQHGGSLSGSNA